jgi:catechol 2,3-dioxygenase-like lactoylglutathione lyase family enzyme/N-acetylglutamate synthase-like GNAT family acetyltransferase
MNLNHVTIIASNLARSVSFYEALGLTMIVHEPPNYARFRLPHGQATLSVLVTAEARPMGSEQSRIFFECADLDERCASLAAAGVKFAQSPTEMPYRWREAHLRDPDEHDVRLYRAGPDRLFPPARQAGHEVVQDAGAEATDVHLEQFDGPRNELRHLFELADDSAQAIDRYLGLGDVIVARQGAKILGHIQLITCSDNDLEVQSLAVLPAHCRQGIASRLLASAAHCGAERQSRRIKLKTAIASLDALAFYLRRGFRISGIARDTFTPERGYAEDARLGGIPLTDAIELDLMLPGRIAGVAAD